VTRNPNQFSVLDSGKRESFPTGSNRDAQAGKPRFDLIPLDALTRLANLYAAGAVKYGENNWQKGQPFSRVYASMFRHLVLWAMGNRDEDHLAAVAWNAFALMHYEDAVLSGALPDEIVDKPELRKALLPLIDPVEPF
jgi:hypothetical protein